MSKKPFILFTEGADSVGKDYFIDNVTRTLAKNNVTYRVASIKPFISVKLKSKLSNRNISSISIDETNQLLLAHNDYIDYVVGLTSVSDIEVIILNRTIISYILYQLHCSREILDKLSSKILFLPDLNNERKQIIVNNFNVDTYNRLYPDIFEDVLKKYDNLAKKVDHLFIHLIHRAYGDTEYYNFALNFTVQTFIKKGLSNFDVNTIMYINNLYNEKFGLIMREKFPNVKSITLTSDYHQYVADKILSSFKEGEEND